MVKLKQSHAQTYIVRRDIEAPDTSSGAFRLVRNVELLGKGTTMPFYKMLEEYKPDRTLTEPAGALT